MRAKDVLIAQIFGGSSGGGGGGGAVDVNADVRFIDYDGEVVDSYSAEEFASLSALPANPSHEGLVAQGWNWSLADAQEYVADYGFLDIGQLYATESGATEIDISLSEGRTSPYLGFAVNGTAEVDWGDGSAVEEITGTSTYQSAVIRTKHDYPDAADYTIKINVSGAAVIHGSSDYSYLLTNGTGSYTPNYAYINAVKRIRMGEGMKVSMNGFTDLEHLESISIRGDSFEASLYYTFQNCYSIKSVTIPGGVTGIDYSAFASCYALNNVSLPKTLTAIGSYVFQDCSNLKRVSIPSGVSTVGSAFSGARTLEKFLLPSGSRFQGSSIFNSCPSLKYVELVGDTGGQSSLFYTCVSLTEAIIHKGTIGNQCFYGCYALKNVEILSGVGNIQQAAFQQCRGLSYVRIPSSVTNIGQNAFAACYSLKEVHVEATTPPTLGASAFSTLNNADGYIYVPNASVDAYKAATNWSTYADRIVGE